MYQNSYNESYYMLSKYVNQKISKITYMAQSSELLRLSCFQTLEILVEHQENVTFSREILWEAIPIESHYHTVIHPFLLSHSLTYLIL